NAVYDSAALRKESPASAERKFIHQAVSESQGWNVHPDATLAGTVVSVFRRRAVLQIPNVARPHKTGLEEQSANHPALRLHCQRMILMAGSIGGVRDPRILREERGLLDVGARISHRLVDVVGPDALPRARANVGYAEAGRPLLMLNGCVVLHAERNAQIWAHARRD